MEKSKPKRKLNSKIKKFFTQKKTFSAPKISKTRIQKNFNSLKRKFKKTIIKFNRRKLKMFFRKQKRSLSAWKLNRLRAKAIKAENKSQGDNFKFRISNFQSIFNNRILNLKNPKQVLSIKTFKHSNFIQNSKLKIKNFRWRFRLNLNSKFFKKSFAAITILAVIVTAYFQNTPRCDGTDDFQYQNRNHYRGIGDCDVGYGQESKQQCFLWDYQRDI